jgi:hypothetical protein
MKKLFILFVFYLIFGSHAASLFAQHLWYDRQDTLEAGYMERTGWNTSGSAKQGYGALRSGAYALSRAGHPPKTRFPSTSKYSDSTDRSILSGRYPILILLPDSSCPCDVDGTDSSNTRAWRLAHTGTANGIFRDSLYQHNPTKFDEATAIGYSIAKESPNTFIRILTLDGMPMALCPITKCGEGQVVIPANMFKNGIFIYELIVDGEMIASHKLVLTR